MVGSISSYLKDAAHDEMHEGAGDFTALSNLIGKFNSNSKTTGYTFHLIQTKNGYSNPRAYEYEVRVTLAKK